MQPLKFIVHPLSLSFLAVIVFVAGFFGGLCQIGYFLPRKVITVQKTPAPPDQRVQEELDRLHRLAMDLDRAGLDAKQRAADLDKRELKIRQAESQLELEMAALREFSKKIDKIKLDLESRLVLVDTSVDGNVQRLSKIYSTMTPENAAKILATLPDASTVQILRKMKEQQSAKVFDAWAARGGQMTEKATRISTLLKVAVEPSAENNQ